VPCDRSRTSQPLELALYLVRSASTHGKAEALHYASQRIGVAPVWNQMCGFRKFWPLDSGNSGAFRGGAGRL